MSKKIILRQSVKSGVAVVFFFGLGMASINAQTTQTTQPTGKVGINTTNPTETLDVKGKVRIQELYTDNQQTGTNNATFTATNVVTVDNNGVLGKKTLSSITAAQTPNLPWKKVASTDNAVPAEGLKIYSKYAVGIGDYSAAGSSVGSSFEINGGGTSQLGLINGTNKWDISTEDQNLTFTKRKPEAKQGRMFSLTENAVMYLGYKMSHSDGSGAKLILDGGNGKIGINQNSASYNLDVAGDAKISGLKTTSDNITNGSTTSKYSPAKMVVVDANGVLGKQDFPTIPTEPWQVAGGTTQANANSQNIYQSGKVGIGDFGTGKSLTEKLEVIGNTSIKGKLNLIDSSDDNNKFLTYTEGTQLLFDKKITVPLISATTTQTGVMASLTNVGKLYLGSGLTKPNGKTIYTENANILLDGQDGKVAIGKNSAEYNLDVKGNAKISGLPDKGASDTVKMVVVDDSGVLKKAEIPTGGGSGNGVKNHTGSNDAVLCNATNAGTIHYKEGVTVNGNTKTTSVMGFCMKTANEKYRWFYIFGGAGTTAGSEADAPNFGEGIQ